MKCGNIVCRAVVIAFICAAPFHFAQAADSIDMGDLSIGESGAQPASPQSIAHCEELVNAAYNELLAVTDSTAMAAAFRKSAGVLSCKAFGVTMNSSNYYRFMKQFSYKVSRYGLGTTSTSTKADAVALPQ